MAEIERTTSPHDFLEVMETSDINLSMMSETENLSDDVILISPLTPPLASLPALDKHQLWMDTDCEVSTTDKPFSVKPTDSVRETDPLFGSELVPKELLQRAKLETHKCSECKKVFRTVYDLNVHLLTHQPQRSLICNISQKDYKRHDHLKSHMLTHQKRKDHHCPYPGCPKMYCGYRSLKRHYTKQHSTHLFPSSSQPSTINTHLWESSKLGMKDGAFTSADYQSYIAPAKLHSIFQVEGYTDYSNYTWAENLGLSHNTENPMRSQVMLPVDSQSWNLAADDASCSLKSAMDLSASHSAVMSNQWALNSSLGGSLVNPAEPKTVHTWEHNWDFLTPNMERGDQTCKDAPSVQSRKEVTGTGIRMDVQPSCACNRQNQPILLKASMQNHQPPNKQKASFIHGEESGAKSTKVRSSAYQMQPIIPSLLPGPKTKKKRVKKEKILKANNILTLPLPSPKPHPLYLVSPSQVAMASFSKESAPSDTLEGGSATVKTHSGREPLERYTQSSPSRPQVSPTSLANSISLTKDGGVDTAGDSYQANQEVQLSPLVIPVSVPVSSKETSLKKNETQEKVKYLSKMSRQPGLLRSLITPNLVASGFPSQLRTPTYLADHLLNFNPPPYTPPPMLSPLRQGTGLYFNTLPQYEPDQPLPGIFSASIDDKDGISLILDNTFASIKPKINVGSRFQAEIPPLRNPLLILYDDHPAQLVWAPWGDLPTNPETQQKVTEFLGLCCSSVLPGGGTNTELALHCLHEVQGDILGLTTGLLRR
ncbi:zinc finger protein [Clarias magur]|uniref:Zinc finger protein n=1 Tax=Clarias magur TaxID=1594786 RepID=A0A8J4U462_CLAMG|nr:zinc finger protein [Clarias magur]